jgi:hypothetical protein
MRYRLPVLACAILAGSALSGCSGSDTRKALGLEKAPPDEFAVVARAPLSLPPDYQLRPPQPGATRPQEGTVQQQARQSIFRAGQADAKPLGNLVQGGRSDAEMALLRQARAGEADTSIRQTINAEATRQFEADRSFVDTILFWRRPDLPGQVIDARAENQRLRENLALGKAATEGDTPVIQRKKKSLLEGIF